MATRKTIPDLATWLQCFGIFTAVVAAARPKRVPELMAYQAIIAKASQTYRWPSWVVYDQAFRQKMAGAQEQSWAKVLVLSVFVRCVGRWSTQPQHVRQGRQENARGQGHRQEEQTRRCARNLTGSMGTAGMAGTTPRDKVQGRKQTPQTGGVGVGAGESSWNCHGTTC